MLCNLRREVALMALISDAPAGRPGCFDFGLSQTEEVRAQRLHADSIVLDMLFQLPGGAGIYDELPPGALNAALSSKTELWERLHAARLLPLELARTGECGVALDWWRASGLSAVSIDMPVVREGES